MAHPDHELGELTKIVEYDLELTAQLLKSVNSAALVLGRKMATVGEAAAYLGEN